MSPIQDRFEFKRRAIPDNGSLADYPLEELIHYFNVERASGTLQLHNELVVKVIYIYDGWPAYVESDLRSETLGAFLVRSGRLSEEDHRVIYEQMRHTGRRQGDLLIENKLVSPHDLYNSMLEHVTEKIVNCFAWDTGDFSFSPGSDWASNIINLKINPVRTILDGIMKYRSSGRLDLISDLPGTSRTYLRDDSPIAFDKIKLTTEEARIVELVNRRFTISELLSVASSSSDPEIVFKTLYAFYLVELVGFFTAESTRPTPPVQEIPTSPRESTNPTTSKREQGLYAAYLRLRELDDESLLGVKATASHNEIRDAFRKRSAPFQSNNVSDLSPAAQENANELYLKFVKAYQKLTSSNGTSEQPKEPKRSEPAQDKTTRSLKSDDYYFQAKEAVDDGMFEKAVGLLEQALELKPNEPLYEAWNGWALFKLDTKKNRAKAEERIELARRSQPHIPEPYLFLARIYAEEGAVDKANSMYEMAKSKAVGDVEIASEASFYAIRSRKSQGETAKGGKKTKPPRGSKSPSGSKSTGEKAPEKPDGALNQDVGALIANFFSKKK